MCEDLSGKQILLLYSRFFGYDVIVKNKLESFGAQVDLYDARANINSFEKAIRKIDSHFYYRKQRRFHSRIQEDNCEKKYDYIFANDVIDEEILRKYRYLFPSATMLLYLDDSVENMKGVEQTFKYYDHILTFDKRDADIYQIAFRPLFFSDDFKKDYHTHYEFDISFIGTCHSDRLSIINILRCKYSNYKFFFFCYLQSWFMFYYHLFSDREYRKVKKSFFQFKSLSTSEVAEILDKSKCVLDIQHPKQNGLTMRTIETLGARRKLITTNQDIKNYDFYDEKNIHIIDRSNPIIPDAFLIGEYQQVDDSIYEKYSITAWIQEVFTG